MYFSSDTAALNPKLQENGRVGNVPASYWASDSDGVRVLSDNACSEPANSSFSSCATGKNMSFMPAT